MLGRKGIYNELKLVCTAELHAGPTSSIPTSRIPETPGISALCTDRSQTPFPCLGSLGMVNTIPALDPKSSLYALEQKSSISVNCYIADLVWSKLIAELLSNLFHLMVSPALFCCQTSSQATFH